MSNSTALKLVEGIILGLEEILGDDEPEVLSRIESVGLLRDPMEALESLSNEMDVDLNYDLISDLARRTYDISEYLAKKYDYVDVMDSEFKTYERIKKNCSGVL